MKTYIRPGTKKRKEPIIVVELSQEEAYNIRHCLIRSQARMPEQEDGSKLISLLTPPPGKNYPIQLKNAELPSAIIHQDGKLLSVDIMLPNKHQ